MDTLFGARLKALRRTHKKTQKQVADDLHLTRSAYTYYEIGNSFPNLNTLDELATYFGVSVDFLMGRESEDCSLPLHDGTSELLLPQSVQEEQLLQHYRTLSASQQKLLLQWLESMNVKESE